MNLRLALATGLCLTSLASTARAQQAAAAREEVTIGYQGLPHKASGETNTGIQVSDSALLHVGAGVETGYDTNVFYQEVNPIGSPILRSTFFGEIGNATRTGTTGRTAFSLRAGLTYRRYQSDNPAVQPFRNAWMPTAGLSLSTGSGQFGFGLADTFARIEDPPYSGGGTVPITRYNNQASIEGRWSPGGGRLTATLRYTNMVDILTGGYEYGSSDTNYLMLDGAWKWLPKTAIFITARQGYVFYWEPVPQNPAMPTTMTTKPSSYPLLVTTGLRGLLTERTSAVVAIGYMNGFYNGVSTGGFLGSSYAELSFTVQPTLLSRIVLGARHDFNNAIVSSFSYNDAVYASYVQQLAGRFALDLSGRYTHKQYQGFFIDPAQMGRIDNFLQLGASLDYFVRNWVYAGVAYAMLYNNATGSATAYLNDYVKHQVFVRLGLTY
jgi:hypothetical protein